MITIETLCVTVSGLDRAEVERWIALDWVRPSGEAGRWQFGEIDVARLRLIRELQHELGVQEDALPVVLRLLDQLYDARRQLRRLGEAVERTAPAEVREAILGAIVTGGAGPTTRAAPSQ